jgi:hypothetical protein
MHARGVIMDVVELWRFEDEGVSRSGLFGRRKEVAALEGWWIFGWFLHAFRWSIIAFAHLFTHFTPLGVSVRDWMRQRGSMLGQKGWKTEFGRNCLIKRFSTHGTFVIENMS